MNYYYDDMNLTNYIISTLKKQFYGRTDFRLWDRT